MVKFAMNKDLSPANCMKETINGSNTTQCMAITTAYYGHNDFGMGGCVGVPPATLIQSIRNIDSSYKVEME
jgi:hypothetical protein